MTAEAKKDLENKLAAMKVDCEISNRLEVKRVKLLIDDDMKKVEDNLAKTNLKLL